MPVVTVSALGRSLALHLADDAPAALEAAVRRAWTGALAENTASAEHEVDLEMAVPRVSTAPELALSHLSMAVTRRLIGARTGQVWLVHAGAVADDDGRVCMLVGASGAGKTTATRRLAQRFAYVSDETVAVERSGRVLPYRKPLSVVVPGVTGWKRQLSPSELGLRPLPAASLTLSAVVLLDRSPSGPSVPRAVPLGPTDALTAVAAHSSGLTRMAAPLSTIAAHLAAASPVRVEYRDDADLAPLVGDLLAAAGASPTDTLVPVPVPGGGAGAEAPHGETTGVRYVAVPAVEAVGDGSALSVLREVENGDGVLTTVRGLAPAIWRACRSAADLGAVEAAVIAEVGPPPPREPGRELLRTALEELVRAGLVRQTPTPRSL